MTQAVSHGQPAPDRPAEGKPAPGRVVNGVAVGPQSPLLGRKAPEPVEEDMQIELFRQLVGESLPGQPRTWGQGMTRQYPELMLVYAIPNGGARHPKTAGRMKAQGVLASMPDLHLPVMRGPFIGLYVELKAPKRYANQDQRAMHARLREQGHCVIQCQSVEEAVAVIVGYLVLDKNRPSVRPLGTVSGNLNDALYSWRKNAEFLLTPDRRLRKQ